MRVEDDLRPRLAEGARTWPKIAIVVGTILVMLLLLMVDFEAR